MTSPSADKDLLMFCASFKRSPVALVRDSLSEPARSMRCSLPKLIAPVVERPVIYTYIYIYYYIHTHTYTYIHIHTYTYIHTDTYTNTYIMIYI